MCLCLMAWSETLEVPRFEKRMVRVVLRPEPTMQLRQQVSRPYLNQAASNR